MRSRSWRNSVRVAGQVPNPVAVALGLLSKIQVFPTLLSYIGTLLFALMVAPGIRRLRRVLRNFTDLATSYF